MKKNLMKYITVFLFVVFIGCSEDDNTNPNTPPNQNITANLQVTGSSARDFLTSESFNRLVIDLVYVQGFRPTNTAVDNFIAFIEERTFKPNGISVQFTEIPSPGEASLSVQEIADIETEHRTLYNNGDELALFVFFADAPSDNSSGNSVVIGVAYRNTSLAIYEGTIRDLANNSSGIQTATIESAVLNHEIAHLFGLVDLGTPLQSDHLDEENGNHCNVPSCLMEFRLDFGSGMQMMAGNVIPQLDPLCIQDLQANGGK